MSSSSGETGSCPAQLGRDGVQAGEQLVAFLLRDDGDRSEHRGVRARLRDVVTPQAPVEVQRALIAWKSGSWGCEKRDIAVAESMPARAPR
jgi:hypothetical protein